LSKAGRGIGEYSHCSESNTSATQSGSCYLSRQPYLQHVDKQCCTRGSKGNLSVSRSVLPQKFLRRIKRSPEVFYILNHGQADDLLTIDYRGREYDRPFHIGAHLWSESST
jgi:hypothetical protein